MAHTTAHPHTDGMVIHWATRYDLLVPLSTFGRVYRVRRAIADLAQVGPGDAALDVGCGPGDLALVLAERVGPGGMVAGIDASPEMIARARQKARRRGQSVDFRNEPVEALTFADASFDTVVSSFVVHHLPGNLRRQAMASIARVLKPGGRVFLVDFMPLAEPQKPAPMATDMQALADLLRDAGLTDVRTGRGLPSMGFLTKLLGIPPLGYVSARKPG
ncbi:MAG TPA: methyltransferase domain-containing protein [Ktedonobacterales bacterium]|nr:methyltransferase domain-containing protein [Ktedonobacterales bacterium]